MGGGEPAQRQMGGESLRTAVAARTTRTAPAHVRGPPRWPASSPLPKAPAKPPPPPIYRRNEAYIPNKLFLTHSGLVKVYFVHNLQIYNI